MQLKGKKANDLCCSRQTATQEQHLQVGEQWYQGLIHTCKCRNADAEYTYVSEAGALTFCAISTSFLATSACSGLATFSWKCRLQRLGLNANFRPSLITASLCSSPCTQYAPFLLVGVFWKVANYATFCHKSMTRMRIPVRCGCFRTIKKRASWQLLMIYFGPMNVLLHTVQLSALSAATLKSMWHSVTSECSLAVLKPSEGQQNVMG